MNRLIKLWKEFINFFTPKKSSRKSKDILNRSEERVAKIKARIEDLRSDKKMGPD